MRHSIVCIGEAMVEVSPEPAFTNAKLGFAGDTFNTAWYLARLSQGLYDVQFASAVGQDVLSDRFVERVEAAGIASDLIIRDPERSMGLYMIHLDHGERSFSYWRSVSAARQLATPELLDQALASGTILYLSGITLAILDEAGRVRLEDCLSRARGLGKTIVFDTNLRPKLWDSTDNMRETVMRFARCADVILPSYDDEALFFDDASPAATLNRYAETGAGLVVLKNGPEEVLTRKNGDDQTHSISPVQQIVDTTAAGDSFNAGFLCSFVRGGSLEASVQTGARLAAQVIQGHGALVNVDVDSANGS